ncbi:uncharacterized protein KGF55_001020 [Candida pseudojiufengensis]|uniref:uncharacterized protein n=1 Tax=Candida pseudojiufengensis TaxID=497109 RepID=UPI0022257B5B|nr:uncharacterized protein KGF55_001020 [Candida pseudojiufengensis]KAI5965658.1 hypothetical protein KGF55_001020 [Candida pseudojiufengensis]
MRSNDYHRLPTESSSTSNLHNNNNESDLPSNPPQYYEFENEEDNDNNQRNDNHQLHHHTIHESTSTPSIEQFEIEEPEFERRHGFINRAQAISHKFANNFNNRVIHPVTRMIDPIYEGYKYVQMQYERSILKLGNPLVVKRLLYVLTMMVLVFAISKYSENGSIKGGSGTFAKGRFYEIDRLSDSVNQFINPKNMKENLEYFSSIPHLTGTKGDLLFAKYIEKHMKSNGLHNVELDEFQSFTNYPTTQSYLKLKDGSFHAKLYEKNNKDMQNLAFNPNSLSTIEEIEGNYVYVNYGKEEDYAKINNVNLENKIVLIKYGGDIPESNKVLIAQNHKAKAVVFITPKFDDQDDVIQKINVGLTRFSPGDILTPGWSSDNGFATRLSWEKSKSTPKIPSIPISWKDGQELIKKLNNGYQFSDFTSGNGDSPILQFKISNVNKPVHPLWNVVGSIEGREQSEKGIIIGSARDSTCDGTMSSNTGTVAFLELIKVLTSLQRKFQWIPSRSIFFVSFDATEYNLGGSTEWIENRKETLRREGYLYIDMSDLVTGDELFVNSHPILKETVKNSLAKVKVDGDKTMNDISPKIVDEFSDYANYIPFINLVNIPSLEIKFRGKNYPKNSCYDSFERFEKSNIDKLMLKHSQLVELLSRIIIDFVETPLIPYNFVELANQLKIYENDLEKYANSIIENLKVKPILHYDGLKRSLNTLKDVGEKYNEWAREWRNFITQSGGLEPPMYSAMRGMWNNNMIEFNNRFISRNLQFKRSGYKNFLFGIPFSAPLNSNEYNWGSFPFVREYIQQHDFSSAQNEIDLLASTIEDASMKFITL